MSYLPDDLTADSFLVLGVAHCFYKADGEVHGIKQIEPIPSACLETLLKKVPTAYEVACVVSLGAVLKADGILIPEMLVEYGAQVCIDFAERAIATARTYQAHPHLQKLLPTDRLYTEFNFSLDKKRILNAKRIVKDEDNVKQHAHTHKVL